MQENQQPNKPEIQTTKPDGFIDDTVSKTNSKANDSLELHIDEQKSDHFVLNLKDFNLHNESPAEQVKHKIQETSQKATYASEKLSQKLKSKAEGIDFSKFSKLSKVSKTQSTAPKKPWKENLKFAFNTVLIFIVTFVALNWGAYKQVFTTYYNQIAGTTDTTLQIFSADNTPSQPNSNLVYASSSIISDNLNIPKLTKEITPPGTRIIIPSINTNVPVIDVPEDRLLERNWTALENEIQNALRSGVVHYPGTPLPGQSGNVVITGHSSYYPWDPGRFKDVFAVLHNLKEGDEIIIFHRQQKYTYRIGEIKKVFPYEVDVLNDFKDDRLTLITCTPIGTNLKRLIVTAFPV